MSLGGRLRQFIVFNGMTVRGFARKADIPERSVHEYLADKRKPGADHLAGILAAGVDLRWLLTGHVRSEIVFDFSTEREIGDLGGIAGAYPDLASHLMAYAFEVVDTHIKNNPDDIRRMGTVGIVKSIWVVYICFMDLCELHADKIERMVREGWDTKGISELITAGLREGLVERFPLEFREGSPPGSDGARESSSDAKKD